MRLPGLASAVPVAAGVVALLAGMLQLSAWKAHQLDCCRKPPAASRTIPAEAASAFRYGLRLGLHCSYCCAPLTALLLVAGVMDLRVMAVVTAAVTAERLAQAGERVARATGVLIVAAGSFAIVRAVGLG